MQPRRAFTLIEILVVLAAIAILAAIFTPVFLSARERARSVSCLSNMRQLGIAMSEYVADNDHAFPVDNAYDFVIYPYLRSYSVYQCPDDPTVTPDPSIYSNKIGASKIASSNMFVLSYAGNELIFHPNPLADRFPPDFTPRVRESDLRAPSKTVEFFEIQNCWDLKSAVPNKLVGQLQPLGSDGDGKVFFFVGKLVSTLGGYAADSEPFVSVNDQRVLYATGNMGGRTPNFDANVAVQPRHSGGANYLACDDHVIWLRPDQVSSGGQSPASNCNQGPAPRQPQGCIPTGHDYDNGPDFAAGTENPAYQLTFSLR